jgi:hypothetical protein
MTLSVCVGLALSGCGTEEDADTEPGVAGDVEALAGAGEASNAVAPDIGMLAQPLRGGSGGGGLGYTCSGLECSCTGDIDCNDMFGSGVCGDIASCDTSDPLNPTCKCLILRVKQPVRGVTATTSGVFQLAR